jgi:CheY-like chemotaxis protein
MLEMRRIRVVEASSGEEAIKVARLECPEVIFMDLYMPGVDGLEAGKEIRKLNGCEDTTLIAYSAFDSSELRAEAIDAGFTLFLVKPLGFSDLDNILRPYLSAR